PNSPDIVSIERIEVLKGPSAFLYGRGDPGGTFNIVTKQPVPERSFAIGTQYGSYNTKRSTFDATGALDEGGTVLARLTGAVEDNGSFRDFVHSDRYYLAPVIAWKPNADTTVTLEGEFISAGQIFDRGIVPFRGDLRAVPRSRYIGEPGLAPFRNDNALGQLRVEHRLNSDWVLNAGAQVLAGNIAGDAVQTVGFLGDGRLLRRTLDRRELTWSDLDLQINLAGKFETGFLRHTLLVGLERDSLRYREDITRSNFNANPFVLDLFAPRYGQPLPALTVPSSNLLQNTTSYAGYVQDQIDLTPKLHALVGVRVEDITLDTTSYINNTTTRSQGTAATPRF
ncbi:TonB-dependent receptor, partial [Methylobacterium tarhaniae]